MSIEIDLEGRTAIVTGAAGGVGWATVEALRAAGASVVAEDIDHAVRELADGDDGIVAVVGDVADTEVAEQAVATAHGRFGGLDVLVNNAGVGVGAPIADLAAEEWHRIIDTNLTGVFHCTKAAIPRFRRRGGGWIISISSLASKNPFVGGAAYCASKAALNAFSEALMQEVRHENIRVSYVLPGSVATGFSGRPSSAGSDWRLQPGDVAQVIVDLLAHPARSLPSRVEIRPSQPQKS
jgi:3-oxoacyl-[acyl-carrier protein] reductase